MLVLAMVAALAGCGAEEALSSSATAASSLPVSSVAQPNSLPVSSAPVPVLAPVGTNALTGLAAAEGLLEGQRPVAIAVMNSQRSLPQRGLAAADVLVEMLIDSAETRLLALYGDFRAIPPVGPVHATYDQFVQFSLPLDAVQVHIDKSPYAANLLSVLQQKDIDGIHLGKVAFWFDEARQLPRLTGKLNEYCWYTDATLVMNGMTYIDVLTVGAVPPLFTFGPAEGFAPAQDAHYVQGVFSGQSTSGFQYNPDQGLYFKTNYGAPHTDEDGTQLAYSNVFFLSVGIGQKADSGLLEYDFTQGTGWYFTGGGLQEITWQKGGPQEAFAFAAKDGTPLAVKPGKSYMGFVPTGQENSVTWQSAQQVADAQAAAAAAAQAAAAEAPPA